MDLKQLKREFLDDQIDAIDGPMLDATAHMLFEIDSPDRLMRIAARFVAQRLGACRTDIGLASHRDRVYRSKVEWLSAESEPPSMTCVDLPNQNGALQRVWSSDTPVAYNDCYNLPDLESLREGLTATRTHSLVARRLEVDGKSFGLICVDQTTHAREWCPEAFQFLDSFCLKVLSPLLDRAILLCQQNRPSPAELDAIRLAASGLAYKEIARELGKSVRTIEHQLRNARQKMKAANQADLVMKCQAWI